jgi:hypothetical protein
MAYHSGRPRSRPRSVRKPLVAAFYAAVKNGLIAASCQSNRPYQYAVLHTGLSGTFATFHTSLEGAQAALTHMRESSPTKEIVAAVRTKYLVQVDAPFELTEADGALSGR